MMGAIDDPGQESSVGSRTGIRDGDRTLHVEELHLSKSRGVERGNQVRGILRELKNLQQGVDDPHQYQSLQELSQSERYAYLQNKENFPSLPLNVSALRGNDRSPNVYPAFCQERDVPLYDASQIPKFLRMPAEKETDSDNLYLPQVPLQAWTEDRVPTAFGSSFTKMPLLRLDERSGQNNLFHNPAQDHFPLLPAPQHSVFSYQQPAGSVPTVPIPSQSVPLGPFGIPLLSISKRDTQFMNVIQPSFGRLIDPSVVLAHEQEIHEQEMEKQKQGHPELEAQQFGQQLLRMDLKTRKDQTEAKEKRRYSNKIQ